MDNETVFIIDDHEKVRKSFRQMLELEAFQVKAFASAQEFLNSAKADSCKACVVVTDIKMPDISGLELLDAIQLIDADIPVVLVTGHADINIAIDGMKRGAYDFIEKPVQPAHIIDVVRKAMRQRALILENRRLRLQLDQEQNQENLIGQHSSVLRLCEQIRNLGVTGVDVLIRGETGSGKEVVARELHRQSPRKRGRFVALNCGAIPEELIESELFGHEQGAFTSASRQRIGKIEYADGGTLFLDEIESMPLNVQVKMLRVLQERRIERLGSNTEIPLDFTVLAASKADLKTACAEGRFREDLFYRLDVATLDIPPLRERGNDVLLLFNHFAMQAAERYERESPPLNDRQQRLLLQHDWPGNVRECQNLAEKWVLGIRQIAPFSRADRDLSLDTSLDAQVADFERQVLLDALETHQWKINQTAEYLQVPRKKLYLRMKKHQIEKLED
jgi:two-component system C4-dicarboxylate transport response regulator DctD